jgi:Na+:H+ antiporter, NhaA family
MKKKLKKAVVEPVKKQVVEPIRKAFEPLAEPLINPIRDLAESGRLTGVLLLVATGVSMVWANSAEGEAYLAFWEVKIGPAPLYKTISHWINDGLMAIFFFFVGLEIKRELLEGELSTFQQALLPGGAAIGGAVVPALVFVAFNYRSLVPGAIDGWAIPTATDIAFSLGMLSLLGSRVPFGLKVLLTAIAVIDDLIAVLIIALFYTGEIHTDMLFYAAGVLAVLGVFNYFGLRRVVFYLVPGLLLWFFILKSGIHATLAGVLLAMTIPLDEVDDLEHALYRPVNFIIMPIFALANTGVVLSGDLTLVMLSPLSLGIIAGLFLGKPLGIVTFSWALVRSGWVRLPAGLRWRHILGLGFTAGIGFTMSIFITNLSFPSLYMQNTAKLAILIGTLLAGITGLFWLAKVERPLDSKT